jgi:hypothetical protein
MLKNLTQYDKSATTAKFKDISCQLSASLLDVFGVTREHLWMNQGYKKSDGDAQRSEMVAVLGTLCKMPPRKSNQQPISLALTKCRRFES